MCNSISVLKQLWNRIAVLPLFCHAHAQTRPCWELYFCFATGQDCRGAPAAARALGDAAKAKAAADATDAADAEGQNADGSGTDQDADTEMKPAPSTPVKEPEEPKRILRSSPGKPAVVSSPKPAADAKKPARNAGTVDKTRVQAEEQSPGRERSKRRRG